MKKALETGQEKLQQIAELLRCQTLEPAEREAERIIAEAKESAQRIIREAHENAEAIQNDAKRILERERKVFESFLIQASKQCLEALRQAIEKKFFNEELIALVEQQTADPSVIAKFITVVINAIEKEGLAVDLTAVIPTHVSVQEVNQFLAANILQKLKQGSVVIGEIGGGAKVLLEEKKMVLEISDKVIEDLFKRYLRKDYRKLLFGDQC